MLETIIVILATTIGGYAVDRWKYGRDVARITRDIAAAAEAKGGWSHAVAARKAAEAAIIQANFREAERAARELDRLRSTSHQDWLDAVDKAEREAAARRSK